MRLSSPSSALVVSALRRLTCSRSAPTGLTTKSTAPARIAETTLSMPPCAVCTITGTVIGVLPQTRQDAETVEVRHHQVEDHAVDRGAVRPGEQRCAGVAAFGDHDLIAEFLQHALEEPALHRIVIDNENGQSVPLAAFLASTLCRFGALWPAAA